MSFFLRSCGSGRPIVFLHGTNSDGQTAFGGIIHYFSSSFSVITPDFAGCGRSEMDPNDMTLESLVAQVKEIIELSDPPVVLIGHSLGALVAVATASKYPALVKKLVLVAGWADGTDPRHQMVFNAWAQMEKESPDMAMRYGLSLAIGPAALSKLGADRIDAILRGGSQKLTPERIELGRDVDVRAYAEAIRLLCSGRL